MPKVVSRADLLTAHRAILFVPGLTAGEKAVGGAILAHYNENTGQCDPGATRLAQLLGVKRHTIFRAITKLQALGILTRRTYGGKAHRNSYTIDWRRCEELDRDANRAHRGTVKSPREPSPDGDGQSATLTPNRVPMGTVNATLEQCPDGHGEQCPDGHTNDRLVKRRGYLRPKEGPLDRSQNGLSGSSGLPGQRPVLTGIPGGKSASHQDAADAAEGRRLASAIAKLPKHEQEAAWLAAMERAEGKAIP